MRLEDYFTRYGQSIWLDELNRDLVRQGELARLVGVEGLRGVTSNPTIFARAMSSSDAYEAGTQALLPGEAAELVAMELMVEDIRQAADILRPVYDRSSGTDGFASLEMAPSLAHDVDGAVEMARWLCTKVDRPNVMIKIPGTREGVAAFEKCIGTGLNINVTLLFSVKRYEEVAEAYVRGLECRRGDLARGSASVASFFVSRVDAKVDKLHVEGVAPVTAAIANAKLAYESFRRIFSGPRWHALVARGAVVQRPLWASTTPKEASIPKTKYVFALLAADTVSTVAPVLLEPMSAEPEAGVTLLDDVDGSRQLLASIPRFDGLMQELLDEGIAAFAKSWKEMVGLVESKRLRRAG
jgi:transaldolase